MLRAIIIAILALLATIAIENTFAIDRDVFAKNRSVIVNDRTGYDSFVLSLYRDVCVVIPDRELRVVCIAQAILESSSGTSRLSKYNNLFGIKCWKCNDYVLLRDDYNKFYRFRKFNTIRESVVAYKEIVTSERYGTNSDMSVEELVSKISSRYATDERYKKKLNDVIKKYKLKDLCLLQ